MEYMFKNTIFNQDISNWNVSNVWNMSGMFSHSKFNQDISNWDVSNVMYMTDMFEYSSFNQDISNWHIKRDAGFNMFRNCQIKDKYKPKFND